MEGRTLGRTTNPRKSVMQENNALSAGKAKGLSSAKREDIWALIVAGIVMIASITAPDGVHSLFKKVLFFF